MRRFVTISAATLVAVLVAIPGGLAQDVERWSAFGQSEPSTTWDTSEYMWQAPPTAVGQIYFNGFSTYGNPGNGAANNIRFIGTGNVGALETQNEVIGMETQVAIFGVWTDCNGDGYIGHAESGLMEYKSALLLDDTLCAPSSSTSVNRWNGANNYNGWVTELIPISRDSPSSPPGNRDQRVYYDASAMVWGDNGHPDQALGGDGGTASNCALTPVPRGTWATTGGLFNYLDCTVAFNTFWNVAWQDERTILGEPVPTDTDPLDLGFEGGDARGSAVDMQLFGDDSTEHSAVNVWDCGSPYLVRGGDVLNMTPAGAATADNGFLHNTALYGVAPSGGNTGDATVAGTYNATNEGLEGTDADPEGNDACNTDDDRGAEFYGLLLEGDVAADVPDGKTDAEWNFIYTTSNRGEAPWNVLGQASGNGGSPQYLGVYGFGFSGWDCFCVTFGNTPDVPFPRFALGDFDPADPTTLPGAATGADVGVNDATPEWVSYYAYTSLDGFTFFSTTTLDTPGGLGSYGAVQCDGVDSGLQNGWNCDPATWYRNADGTLPDDIDLLAKVGSPYTHRDVDCLDGTNNAGVPMQPAAIGTQTCARPS